MVAVAGGGVVIVVVVVVVGDGQAECAEGV